MRILNPSRRVTALTVLCVLLSTGWVIPAQAQNRVIIINADQPNVWTLEQAHYLLAQMHRRNLDLRTKSLEDLDPNEIAGLRFDVMKMLVEFGATFNQADLASNRMFTRHQEFNTERRDKLTAERDRLRNSSLTLTEEIAELETKLADAKSDEEKASLEAKIASKKTVLAKVDKELANVNSELQTLNVSTGELKGTTGGATFDPGKMPQSVFDDAFKQAAAEQIKKFNEAPKINASLKLENFLHMQYEIIAKQLSLLRDEVGPGERLLFLELPQTVNVSHHESNKKWAQSWWKIAGYTVRCPTDDDSDWSSVPPQCPPGVGDRRKGKDLPAAPSNQRPITTTQEVNSILRANNQKKRSPDTPRSTEDNNAPSYVSTFVNLDKAVDPLSSDLKGYLDDARKEGKVDFIDRHVRSVELIPRQSSLNVNDMKLKTRAGAFNFVLSTLFGFGSQLSIQRQREQFSQFVQQELYSSAFGKGSREFGWTFTPMPGTDRLLSGVRTTYAIVVVPKEATSLVLESNGCYFPRSAYQPNDFADTKETSRWGTSRTSRGCGERSKAFLVTIPSAGVDGSNDFWVKGISYQPVGKGERIVVLISGENFSSQTGVLINGTPLIHSIGLAQPLIRDDSVTGRLTREEFATVDISGHVERVDSNKIMFSFKMPKDFEGTPTITLVAPGKAIDINWLTNIAINGDDAPMTLSSTSKDACQRVPVAGCVPVGAAMFMGDPVRPLRIDSVEAFRSSLRQMNVLITGAGFMNTHRVFINGVEYSGIYVSPSLLRATDIAAPTDDQIQITLDTGEKTIKSKVVINPMRMDIEKVTVVSYDEAEGGRPGVLVVRIEGVGFPTRLVASPRKVRVDVTSTTEAYLTITGPNKAEVVTLRDPITGLSIRTVVVRKSPE